MEDVASLVDYPGEYLQILGVDIFSDGPLRTFTLHNAQAQTPDVVDFIRDSKIIALSRKLVDRLHLKIGDPVRVATQTGTETFRLGFILDFGEDAPGADEHLSVMDIANVQENFLQVGKLNRISALLRPGADFATVAARLRRELPAGTVVQAPDRRNRQISRMLGAFQLNLTALSLVSLLVGMFLIYNTVAASVVRRRHEIGVLRALGLSAWQVQMLFLAEALLLGLIGAVLGLFLGVGLATQLVGVVSKTITSLYILDSIHTLFVTPLAVVMALGLCMGAVVLAAWFPSREAAMVAPVEALAVGHLEEKSARGTGRTTIIAVAMLLLAALLAWNSLTIGPGGVELRRGAFHAAGLRVFHAGRGRHVCAIRETARADGAPGRGPLRAVAAPQLGGHRVARRGARDGRWHLHDDLQLPHHGGGMAQPLNPVRSRHRARGQSAGRQTVSSSGRKWRRS